METRDFDFNAVVEQDLDGSRVFAVRGYDMTGARLLVIDCDSSETASTLADLLSEHSRGVEVRDRKRHAKTVPSRVI